MRLAEGEGLSTSGRTVARRAGAEVHGQPGARHFPGELGEDDAIMFPVVRDPLPDA